MYVHQARGQERYRPGRRRALSLDGAFLPYLQRSRITQPFFDSRPGMETPAISNPGSRKDTAQIEGIPLWKDPTLPIAGRFHRAEGSISGPIFLAPAREGKR